LEHPSHGTFSLHPQASLHLRYLLEEALNQGYLIESLHHFAELNRLGHKIIDHKTGREMIIIGQNEYPDLSHTAKYLTKHKFLTYELFRKEHISTPKTFCFHSLEEFQWLWEKELHLNRVVVKPENQGLGRDVFLETHESAVLQSAKSILEKYQGRGIIQEFVHGHDLRIQAVGGKFFAACRRIPANIIGNGINTVKELVHMKNREKSQFRAKNLIIVTKETHALLAEQGLKYKGIPEINRHVRLRKASNVGIGGDPIDVTESVHPEYHRLLEKLSAMLGMKTFALDFVVEDETKTLSEGNSHLLEINAPSMWGLHHFAMGTKRNVALGILDAHFHPQSFNPEAVKYLIRELHHRPVMNREELTPYFPHSTLSS